MLKFAITTEDNPFDPFDEFDSWLKFDEDKGYFTLSMLARVADFTHELSEHDQGRIVEHAIDTIVELNPYGNARKLIREVKEAVV